MKYKLAFVGFGNVARALIELLERKRATLNVQYNITYSITGLATGRHREFARGSCQRPAGHRAR